MNYEFGSERQLSSGALQFLDSFKLQDNKRNIYVNFIFQIYNCVQLIHNDYYSCCLFDKENICNTFILKYNEYDGRPFPGDIIFVTKINISILIDGKHKLYICEEVKLLEKNKKFLINPKTLKSISSKIKFDNKNNNFSSKKNIPEETKKIEEKMEEINFSQNEAFFEELPEYSYDINNAPSINNTSNIINKDDKNSDKKDIKVIIKNSNEKAIKINPQKNREVSQNTKDKIILNSINFFIGDFKDGTNENNNNNKFQNKEEKKKEKEKEMEKPNDYSLLMAKKNKIHSQIQNENPESIKTIQIENPELTKAQFKYISEINRILFDFKNIPNDSIFKIKCYIDRFNIGKNIFYLGCPICNKPIKEKTKTCCNGATGVLLYQFSIRVKDPSGKCVIFFHNKNGRDFMSFSPEKLKDLLNDETPRGKIIFSEYQKDFFDNEFMIWIEFMDDPISKNKKLEGVHVERIDKVNKDYRHRYVYEMINKLKNILV